MIKKTNFNFDNLDEESMNPNFNPKKYWLEHHYPLTVIADRYNGTYSGGDYTALPCDYWKIPADGPDGSDIPCQLFWSHYIGYVGVGATAEEAIKNLCSCVENNIHYNEIEEF